MSSFPGGAAVTHFLDPFTFQIPSTMRGEPRGPAQKRDCLVIIFLLVPFPWYGELFHDKPGASSLHFLEPVAFGVFTAAHMFLMLVHDVAMEAASLVLERQHANGTTAIIIVCVGWGNSHKSPRASAFRAGPSPSMGPRFMAAGAKAHFFMPTPEHSMSHPGFRSHLFRQAESK